MDTSDENTFARTVLKATDKSGAVHFKRRGDLGAVGDTLAAGSTLLVHITFELPTFEDGVGSKTSVAKFTPGAAEGLAVQVDPAALGGYEFNEDRTELLVWRVPSSCTINCGANGVCVSDTECTCYEGWFANDGVSKIDTDLANPCVIASCDVPCTLPERCVARNQCSAQVPGSTLDPNNQASGKSGADDFPLAMLLAIVFGVLALVGVVCIVVVCFMVRKRQRAGIASGEGTGYSSRRNPRSRSGSHRERGSGSFAESDIGYALVKNGSGGGGGGGGGGNVSAKRRMSRTRSKGGGSFYDSSHLPRTASTNNVVTADYGKLPTMDAGTYDNLTMGTSGTGGSTLDSKKYDKVARVRDEKGAPNYGNASLATPAATVQYSQLGPATNEQIKLGPQVEL